MLFNTTRRATRMIPTPKRTGVAIAMDGGMAGLAPSWLLWILLCSR